MAGKKLRVTELDFDGIKANLIDFLKEDSVFGTDGAYNYEGSAMSALLDVLAYNTHYMGYYVNVLANEMFLDSASRRESIVSIAKHLGYTPASSGCASITIDIESTGASAITESDKFTGTDIDGTSYDFHPIKEYQKTGSAGTGYTSTGIVCREGKKVARTYVKDSNNLDQKFLLDSGVDTSTLKVSVTPAGGGADVNYTKFTEITTTDLSTSYFLSEASDGQFEVSFGDATFGSVLPDGATINLDYVISSGSSANGIGQLTSEINNISSITVTSSATGGSEPQSDESIRFMAPKSYQAQNRAVTLDDFKVMIERNPATNVKTSIVWGGEDNDPPMYGKVFICCKPTSGETLTDTDKANITSILSTNKTIGIDPVIVDPEYTYLNISSTVIYDTKTSVISDGAIQSKIIANIKNYNDVNLNSFNGEFQYTPFVAMIDDSDNAVVSNYTSVDLYKKITPNGNSTLVDSWDLQYNVTVSNITSDSFQLEGGTQAVSFKSVGTDLRLVDSDGVQISNLSYGTVSGSKVTINPINIKGTTDIRVYAEIDKVNVKPYYGSLMNIDQITVTMVRS